MSRRRIVFMLAGQGSQYYLMGRDLYRHNPAFRDWMDYGSRLLEPHLGGSLVDLLYRERPDRFAPFDRTRETHPAIFCLNYAVAQALLAEGIRPACLLGYSLGELVAWALAGVVGFEEALTCVVEMAAKIEERTPEAAMLAVLGPASLFEERPDIFGGTTLACLNYAENFVVSGPRERIVQAQEALRPTDYPSLILPITRGFHSPLLEPLEAELRQTVAGFTLRPPAWPIVSSLRARAMTPQDWNALHCWDLLRFPVRFSETVRYLEAEGPSTYIDVGPSGTLASFVRMVVGRDAASQAYPIVTQYGRDVRNLEKLRADLAA